MLKQQKKTERKYTPALSMKHFCEIIGAHGYKVAYMWFDSAHELHEMTYRELSDSIKKPVGRLRLLRLAGTPHRHTQRGLPAVGYNLCGGGYLGKCRYSA